MACHSINSGWVEYRKWKAQAEFTYVVLFWTNRNMISSLFLIAECMYFWQDSSPVVVLSFEKTLDVLIWYACRHLHARPRFHLHQGFWVARVHSFFLVSLIFLWKTVLLSYKTNNSHMNRREESFEMECWRANKEVFLTIVGKPYYSYSVSYNDMWPSMQKEKVHRSQQGSNRKRFFTRVG